MKAIVTGGAGFIGSQLAERLASSGNDVLVLDNLSSGTSWLPVLERIGVALDTTDLRQERAAKTIESFRPEVIFHLAAQPSVPFSVTDPITDAKVNVIGTLRVLEGARRIGARVVNASSGGTIYGEPSADLLPIREEVEGIPTSPYGITKKVSEQYLRFYQQVHDLKFVNLALANVYGPRQDPHGESGVVAIFARRLLAGEPCVIHGDGKQTRDFVYVTDVVEAFLAAADAGEGETINVGTGIETTVSDLYSVMAKICGNLNPPQYGSARPGDLQRSALDPSKAARLLGWRPSVSLEEGLRVTIDSFQQEG